MACGTRQDKHDRFFADQSKMTEFEEEKHKKYEAATYFQVRARARRCLPAPRPAAIWAQIIGLPPAFALAEEPHAAHALASCCWPRFQEAPALRDRPPRAVRVEQGNACARGR